MTHEAARLAMRIRSQLEQAETILTEHLNVPVVFSERFHQKMIADLLLYVRQDPEERAVRNIQRRKTDEKYHRWLTDLSQQPPGVLQCFSGGSLGEVDPYESRPQWAYLHLRLPSRNTCEGIVIMRTRELVEQIWRADHWHETDSHQQLFPSGQIEDVTKNQVIVDDLWITSDSMVEAARRWLQRFYPPLARWRLVHLSPKEAAMIHLDAAARFAGHKNLADMVRTAQREME